MQWRDYVLHVYHDELTLFFYPRSPAQVSTYGTLDLHERPLLIVLCLVRVVLIRFVVESRFVGVFVEIFIACLQLLILRRELGDTKKTLLFALSQRMTK